MAINLFDAIKILKEVGLIAPDDEVEETESKTEETEPPKSPYTRDLDVDE